MSMCTYLRKILGKKPKEKEPNDFKRIGPALEVPTSYSSTTKSQEFPENFPKAEDEFLDAAIGFAVGTLVDSIFSDSNDAPSATASEPEWSGSGGDSAGGGASSDW